jgi:glycosyltransferase involved in cell wall biosynthesis
VSELATKGIQEKQNVYRFRVGNLSFLNPIKIFIFFLFFKSKKADAVIMNLPADLKVAGIAAKLAGVPKIIYRRGMPHPLRDTFLNRFLFTKVLTHVVVNSKEIGRSLKENNESWFPENKLLLVYNGVDTSKSIDKSKKLVEKTDNEILIGNAGRLTEQKGQKYLIELAKLLRADGVKFKILIAGEGELHQELNKLIQENNLANEIKLMGHVSDMPAFFDSLDVFVFTSLFEGSANTLIEVLQYSVPTVAWNVSSNSEIIQHEETGLLANPFDLVDLQKNVMRLITENTLRARVTETGVQRVNEKFYSNKNLAKLAELLRN